MHNILVVDDEKTIREGLSRFVSSLDGSYCVVGAAEDGEKALEIALESMPDIIITDINMPKMSGIEFIENVKAINPNVKIIIISGYNEFEFAQKALKLGVADYLLKPIEKENLTNVLANACSEIEKNNQLLYDVEKLKIIAKESLPAARDRFLNRLAVGSLRRSELDERSDYLGLELRGKLYTLILIKIKNASGMSSSGFSNEEMVMGFLNTNCTEIFDKFLKVFPFYYENDKLALLICSEEENRQRVFISVNQSLSKAIAFIQRKFGLEICVSIGRLYEAVEDLNKCCREAEDALQYNIFEMKNAIINYEDIRFSSCKYGRPAELEKNLLLHIKLRESSCASEAVDQLFNYYRTIENEDPFHVKMLVLELVVLILRTVDEVLGTESFDGTEEADIYKGVFKSSTLNDLHDWLSSNVLKYMKKIEEKHEKRSLSVVQKAKELTDAFISEPELSIEFLAERLYISPNYLRQLFKHQEGKSFVEYLTVRRMEKAMQLMNDTALKIQEISEKVGFNDSRYFTFCFKKYCQLTPSEYKELRNSSK